MCSMANKLDNSSSRATLAGRSWLERGFCRLEWRKDLPNRSVQVGGRDFIMPKAPVKCAYDNTIGGVHFIAIRSAGWAVLFTERKGSWLHYHTLHLSAGFMWLPTGQRYSRAKSSELESVPITRNRPGLWTAVLSLFRVASGRIAPHQIWAKLRKNSCVLVTFSPGSVSRARTRGSVCAASHLV
uniref:Uncharacterized protein n=1 Tax=Anopheles atroparvus TaxID=41427 RepID=A0AAG5CXF9_ANOAO